VKAGSRSIVQPLLAYLGTTPNIIDLLEIQI
jgi:hypothetical protein